VIKSGYSLYDMDCTMASNVQVSIVGPASPSKATIQFTGTGNTFEASSTQPYVGTWGDPRFSVTYDITANVTLAPLPQPQVTSLSITVSNAKLQTQNTMADILADLDSFLGTGFLSKAENSIDATQKLDPSAINGFLAQANTPLSQASQFQYVNLWHQNDRIIVDLAPQSSDQPRPGSISGVITWTKASNIAISDCSNIKFADTVQLGPAPLSFPMNSFGAAPTDVFGSESVASGPPADMGDHYQCQYTYAQMPLALPNSLAGMAAGSTGQKNSVLHLYYLEVQPSGWNGRVNLNGDQQNGLNFQVVWGSANIPYYLGKKFTGPQNPGDLRTNPSVNQNGPVNNGSVMTSSTIAQNAAAANALVERGLNLTRTGDLAGAASSYGNALALMPDNQVALLNLGLVHLKMGLTTQGKSELQRALQIARLHGDAATARQAAAALRGAGAAEIH